MYLDYKLILSDGQAVTGDANSTNYVDIEAANPDIGTGFPMGVVFVVDTAATGSTGVEFKVCDSATTQPTTGASDVVSSGVIAVATLVAGYTLVLPLPKSIKRYVGAYYNVSNGDETVRVTAYITPLPVV